MAPDEIVYIDPSNWLNTLTRTNSPAKHQFEPTILKIENTLRKGYCSAYNTFSKTDNEKPLTGCPTERSGVTVHDVNVLFSIFGPIQQIIFPFYFIR